MPIIYLYAVKGSKGSRTSYINAVDAWRDLSPEWKDMLGKLHIRPASLNDNYSIQGKVFGLTAEEKKNYTNDKKWEKVSAYNGIYIFII